MEFKNGGSMYMLEKSTSLDEVGKLLSRAQRLMGLPIMSTPTGKEREALTEVNIHINQALTRLHDAVALSDNQN